MNLSPEEKAVGKVNFQAAIGSKLLRRKTKDGKDLLMTGIAKGVAPLKGLGPLYFGYGEELSEPVRVGVIGTGDEGSVLIGAINPKFIEVKAIADLRPYNVYRAFHGDYDSARALKARPGLLRVYGWKSETEARKHVAVYDAKRNGYEGLIKDAKKLGIEAVIIALPLHLHAPAAIAAMKAGLHVITEKLMGHSVRECKEMARVAHEQKLLLATGHQRHYSILYNNAVHLIQQRLLGDIHFIRAQWHRGNLPGTDSWQQPMPREAKPDDPQADKLAEDLKALQKRLAKAKDGTEPGEEGLSEAKGRLDAAEQAQDAEERKRWLVRIKDLEDEIKLLGNRIAQKRKQIEDRDIRDQAAKYHYKDAVIRAGGLAYDRPAIEELIRWRLFNRTGGGLMAELGSHQLDAASIFVAAMHGGQMQHPLSVAVATSRVVFPEEGKPLDRDAEDHVFCIYEFPAPGYHPLDPNARQRKIAVQYSSINGNGFGGYGEAVFGTEGTLLLETEEDVMLFKGADTKGKIKVTRDRIDSKPTLTADDKGDPEAASIGQLATLPAERGYTAEMEHWAWCIRNKLPAEALRCHPKVALKDAVIALTTNIAAQEGGRIEFKEEWFDIDSDETPEDVAPDIKRYK
jgi:predicted dehydrogenase